jgi:hypothetical protein
LNQFIQNYVVVVVVVVMLLEKSEMDAIELTGIN